MNSPVPTELLKLADKIAAFNPATTGPIALIARERRMIEDALRQAASVERAEVAGEAMDDLRTHRDAWRSAIIAAGEEAGHTDDKAYWVHELKAFDRTIAALASPPRSGGKND